ncbi:MAG: cytochrome C [Desulfocapsa sp.]|nr:cytochrome C [Desulfocapsa sp.]
MKKLIVTSMVLGAGFLLASAANAAITDSKHDLSGSATLNNPESQLCIYCHTPHHADTSAGDAPLWNHTLTTTATFTVYSSTTLDAGALGQPGGVSKLCLSCHDGTVALDAFGGMAGNLGSIGADGDLGINLSDDHPISFAYTSALATADGELYDPDGAGTGLGGDTITATMLFTGGLLECASCHDVHNNTGFDPMLLVDNTGSGLCLTCHNK